MSIPCSSGRVQERTLGSSPICTRQLGQCPAPHNRPRGRWYLKDRLRMPTPAAVSADAIVSPAYPVYERPSNWKESDSARSTTCPGRASMRRPFTSSPVGRRRPCRQSTASFWSPDWCVDPARRGTTFRTRIDGTTTQSAHPSSSAADRDIESIRCPWPTTTVPAEGFIPRHSGTRRHCERHSWGIRDAASVAHRRGAFFANLVEFGKTGQPKGS